FLWALLEGAVGVAPHCDRLLIKPRLPHTWKWVRVCGLPYHGRSISWFLTRQDSAFRIYTASDFQTDLPVERLAEDVSDIVQAQGQGISVTALAEPDQILLCVGNTLTSKNPAPLLVRRVLDNARRYRVSLYSSETEHWQQLGDYFGGVLERIALDIEASGFILLRFQPLP
ncbi:MAG TPA: hypothetical protein VHR86_06895, partial [Armatimonadota bacterium]|nr:hypothetical protein [Armatimonadota bacterium]